MSKETIYIGDLVVIKEKLQKLISLPDWGIVINETQIIASDIPEDDDIGPIDSYIVFFPATDDIFTIPKTCLRKIIVIEE